MTSWIDLATVRDHMQWGADASRDAELQRSIDSACASIEAIKGHIGQATIADEAHELGRGGIVILDESPIVSVESVTLAVEGGSPTPIAKADPATGVLRGWTVASAGGVLTIPLELCLVAAFQYGSAAPVLVSYTVGRDPIPADWLEAAIELSAFLFESSQNDNVVGEHVGAGAGDEMWPARGSGGIGAYAMPFRVRELLGLYGKVVKSQVFVR